MNNYYIYKHTNKTNSKVYIGITSMKPEKRWKNGGGYSDQYFNRAIKKYGWDGFTHEILYSNLSGVQAKVMEVSLIHYYDSTNRNYGYNVSEGGNIISESTRKKLSESHTGINHPNYGKHLSEETKAKMSEAHKGAKNHNYGKHLSDEHKAKLSEALKGEKNPMYGKHHTEETRKKMSGANNHNSKFVLCTTTGFAFCSTYNAGRFYNISFSSISQCCNGKRKSAGRLSDGTKLQWKYIKDLKKPPMTNEDKRHLKEMLNKFYYKIQ